MNEDCSKIRLCPEHQRPRPINLSPDPPPDDEPAKNNLPSAVTGDEQHPDGMPATDHFSSPVARS